MSRLVPESGGDRMLWVSTVQRGTSFEGGTTVMGRLAVVEEILRETAVPMSVREIVERAGARLPSKSKTPDTVVARDLSMDIKRKGEGSLFVRTSPGRYTLRTLAPQVASTEATALAPAALSRTASGTGAVTPVAPLGARKPAAAAPARPAGRDTAEGGGYVS